MTRQTQGIERDGKFCVFTCSCVGFRNDTVRWSCSRVFRSFIELCRVAAQYFKTGAEARHVRFLFFCCALDDVLVNCLFVRMILISLLFSIRNEAGSQNRHILPL